MKLSLSEIPKNDLDEFIKLMDGYCGIFSEDRSWIWDENSHPYKITLYCYLISTGSLYVENKKLKSFEVGYEELLDHIEEFFKGKDIVNFTDMFYLNEINQAFCGGKWYDIHNSWITYRPEVLVELANYKLIRIEQAYQILVENNESDFADMYFLKIDNDKTTILDFFEGSILWKKKAFSIQDFRQEFNLGTKDYSIHLISMDDFFDYVMDIVQEEPEVGSLLN